MFDSDGSLDFNEARERLIRARPIHSERIQRWEVAEIQTAALLDIAASLRVVAADAAQALVAAYPERHLVEGEPVTEEPERDFLVIGDLVTVRDAGSEPGEVVKVGVDQGDTYALVRFADNVEQKYYTRNLERVRESATAGAVAEANISALREYQDRAELDRLVKLNADANGEPDLDEDFEPHVFDDVVVNEAHAVKDGRVNTALDALEAKPPRKKGGKK